MKDKKIEEWLIKDVDGQHLSVYADDWVQCGNELKFYKDEELVAYFLRWVNFRVS